MATADDPNAQKTISQTFDKVYDVFKKIVDDSAEPSNSAKVQEQIRKSIKSLEEMTTTVSALDLFSRNENVEEVPPNHLKFLLLPYMLGTLWQLDTKEGRKELCEIAKVYFRDFLKRCVDYDIIKGTSVPLVDENPEGEEENKGPKKPPNSDDKRAKKIQKFKENKELDAKIEALQKKAKEYNEDEFGAYARDIYISLIKRAANEAEDQLDSIDMEMTLIKFQAGRSKGEVKAESANPPKPEPLKPFIITKDDVQKAVFGMGYPALPVMTVEELYQQRRETGQWGPPPASSATFVNPEEKADEESLQKELLEEQDDEAELRRKREYDEYKDDHRRGWGNRFNRS